MQTIQPSKGYVLAKPVQAETKTLSGFHIIDKGVLPPKVAVVLDGGFFEDYPKDCKIIFTPYSMTEVMLNGEEVYLIPTTEILGVLND